MSDTMTHEQWLDDEIRFALEYADRHGDSDDQLLRSQAIRRAREAQEMQRQLATLRGEHRLTVSLSGKPIEGNNAPVHTVQTVIQRLGEIAEECDAETMLAPAGAGSHQIVLVRPQQTQLEALDHFAEFADSLLNLSPQAIPPGETVETHISDLAADYSEIMFRNVRELAKEFHRNDIDVELHLTGRGRDARVRISRDDAGEIHNVLTHLASASERFDLVGVLEGFAPGARRFEIRDEDGALVVGKVLKQALTSAIGLRLYSDVTADIERVQVTLPSGYSRVRYRLHGITASDTED